MKTGWRVVLIIVVIMLAVGAICAGVGALTGADTGRVSSVFEREIETRYNVDPQALLHEWLPEVVQIFRGQLA